MRVFLSWSGATSREVAEALHEWIPLVVQNAKPFMSTGDINKGRRWNDVVGEELSHSDYGIVCITRYNSGSPWLHFEAGAISRALGKSYVSPLLFNVEPSMLEGPLRQFQVTVYCSDGCEHRGKQEIRSLLRSLNDRLEPALRLTDELLKLEFDKWWPDLHRRLQRIGEMRDGATHTPYGWLYSFEDLIDVQKDVNEVWWATPNPYSYVLRPQVKTAIRERLSSGAKYTFLVNKQYRETAKDELRSVVRNAGTIIEIPDAEFHEMTVTDYVVIDPETNARVFLELPLAHEVGPAGTAQGFWIEVFKEVAAGFFDRFKSMTRRATRAGSEAPGLTVVRPPDYDAAR
jgi:TIR domain